MSLLVSALALALPVLAVHTGPLVDPQLKEGASNKTCGDFGTFDFEFKVDDENPNDTYDEDHPDVDVTGGATAFEVTIETVGNVLSWESNFPVDAVFVKGGPVGGNLYDYTALAFDVDHDNGLTTAGGGQYGVSHVSFCFVGPPDESPTPTPTPEETFEGGTPTPSPSPSPTSTTDEPTPTPTPTPEETFEGGTPTPTPSPTATATETEPETGSVVVYKTDSETDELVEGAVFSIEAAPEEEEITVQGLVEPLLLVELAPGIHCIDDLSFGDYIVTETTPPPDYDPADPDSQPITVDSASHCDEDGVLDTPDLTFTNDPTEEETLAGIQVVKTDQDGGLVEGAEFDLYLDDGDDVFDPEGGDGDGDGGGACAGDPNIAAVTLDDTGAGAIADTIVADAATLAGAEFDAAPPGGTPNGTAGCLSWFATNGSSFGILTSGDVNLADDENTSGSSGADIGGDNGDVVRGDTDFDVTVLQLDLTTPAGANCLRFDFAFYSDEFPEYVNTQYNDAFIAELNTTSWMTDGTDILAPNNFAFDPAGDVISINSTGETSMSLDNAAGTTYDGATVLLSAATPVGAGANSLFLSIFDQGDHIYDSAVFVDNVRFQQVADLATECVPGATEAPPGGDVLIDTQTTGADGLATFTELEAGSYWVKESAAPEGCELLDGETLVELTAEDVASGALIQVPLDNDCGEEDVEGGTPTPTPEDDVLGGNPTPTPEEVPDTAAGLVTAGWMPLLMTLLLVTSIGTLVTLNVQSVRSRSRR